MRIAFLWDGVSTNQHRFSDGLYLALKRMEVDNKIGYFEPEDRKGIDEFKPDVLLYWGALCENKKELVTTYPYKKANCFAGGPIDSTNIHGFDLYFTESTVNEDEFKAFNKPYIRAFGINEKIFKPRKLKKRYTGIFLGAFAKWKRPDLFAASVGESGIAIGQHQVHEPGCYNVCKSWGVKVLEEVPRNDLVRYLNQSETAVNPADVWGGGQRMTLEAMACNVPPIVMSDSPKNMEYVKESGYGIICDPDIDQIKDAIEIAKKQKPIGRDYILSKWTSKHYADNLIKGLKQL